MWRALGVLNYEMEAATLFVMASTMGLRAGAVLGVILNRAETESLADGAVAMVIVVPGHELADPTASGIQVGKTLARGFVASKART